MDGEERLKEKAEELQASEIRYRRLFKTSLDGILILDAETGSIIDMNPSLIETMGSSYKKLLGKKIWELGSSKDVVANKNKFAELQRNGYTHYQNSTIETADGRLLEVEIVSSAYEIAHQKVIQCNIRDVTARKHAEERVKQTLAELERSNAELRQFIYVASHDLQEPLHMIASYLQLLEMRYKDKLDADAHDFIGFAVDGANRLQNLIDSLLDYSRVDGRDMTFEPTDMEKVFEAAVANLQVAIKESKAEVTNEPLPTVMANEVQMIQLFQNLLGNAIKFRGKELPRIQVSSEQKGHEWIFSVRDNGIGIEPQYFDRIFIIFQCLHGQEYPGTGIGLPITKRIVERHGGRIWVESEPGKGSTFYFSIPVKGGKQGFVARHSSLVSRDNM